MYHKVLKRLIDFISCLVVAFILFPLFLLIYFLVIITSKGPGLYWSDRVGKNNKIFKMPKFRTMKIDTKPVATHLLENPEQYITRIGKFLRKSSLDEIPQLWSILKGDMSLVGPRPALFNQEDLIELRIKYGVEEMTPGLTGWAQINGRDEIPIPDKVKLDKEYLERISFKMDLYIIFKTIVKVFGTQNISH